MKYMKYIRFVVLVCLALVNVLAWGGETFVYVGNDGKWDTAGNWMIKNGDVLTATQNIPVGYSNVDNIVISSGKTLVIDRWDAGNGYKMKGFKTITIENNATLEVNSGEESRQLYDNSGSTYLMIIDNGTGKVTVNGTLKLNNVVSLYCGILVVGAGGELRIGGDLNVNKWDGYTTIDGKVIVEKNIYSQANKFEISTNGEVSVGNRFEVNAGGLSVDGGLTVEGVTNINSGAFEVKKNGTVVLKGDLNPNNFVSNLVLSGSLTVEGLMNLSPNITITKEDGTQFVFDKSLVKFNWETGDKGYNNLVDLLKSKLGDDWEKYTKPISNNVWTGASDGRSWSIADNWSKGIPSVGSKVEISGGTGSPIVSSADCKAYSITVRNSKSLTINSGSLSVGNQIDVVNGDVSLSGSGTTLFAGSIQVSNTGTFNVNYDVDANPNIVIYGGITGNMTVNRTISTGRIYYTGSATVEGTITSDWTNYFYNMYFNPSTQQFEARHKPSSFVKAGSTIAETLTTLGCTRTSSSKETFTQIGKVMTSVPVNGIPTYVGTSWYSNPYPFALDLQQDAISFANENVIQASLYTRINDGGWKYGTYNLKKDISVPSSFTTLAPFQGFSVLSIGEVPTTMNILPKLSVTHASLKSASICKDNVLRLFASIGAIEDEMALLFDEEGSLDNGEGDSQKYSDTGAKLNISTNKGGKPLVISHFPSAEQLADENIAIPVEISKTNILGDLVIWANISNFAFEGEVFLVDNLTGDKVNLKEVNKYTCSDGSNLYTGRFELLFANIDQDNNVNSAPTDIKNVISDSDKIAIGVDDFGGVRATIFGNVDEAATISVYDLLGRVIVSENITGRSKAIDVPTNGVVVVQVKNGRVIKSKKVVL